MPASYRGHCPDCGHRWDGLRRSLACGRIDFREPETFRSYSCTRCIADLYVPRHLSRSSWLRWVSENVSELTRSPMHFAASELGVGVDHEALAVIARSPLLFRACERVAGILAAAGSRYAIVPIEIGTIECPNCGDPLRFGDIEAGPPACPRCDSPAARWIGGSGPEAVLVDYSPLDDAEVRQVIRHLEGLAENPDGNASGRKRALRADGWPGLLWDRDLDGSLFADECHA